MMRTHWSGEGLDTIERALRGVSSARGRRALRRAVNHTGDKARTAVKRSLAKQVGLPAGRVIAKGRVRSFRASYQNMDYAITSRAGFLSLKEFRPRQLKRGTVARPWGRRELFDHAFMGARPGEPAPSLRGHVFARRGAGRLPIRKLWGPAIPREMVRGDTAATFQATVSALLPARVEHELRAIARGVVS